MNNIKFLTQQEVDELPSATIVNIEWSGGNCGKYELMKLNGDTWTKDLIGNPSCRVRDVGIGVAHTKVWIDDKKDD